MREIEKASGGVVDQVLMRRLESQWTHARQTVASHRRRSPKADADKIARRIVNQFARDVAIRGALRGGLSVSEVGKSKKAVGVVVESTSLLERTACMTLSIAHVYGHDMHDVTLRREALTGIVTGFTGLNGISAEFFGVLGQGLGNRAIRAIPLDGMRAINKKAGKEILFKWRSKTDAHRAVGTVTLEVVLPVLIAGAMNTSTQFGLAQGLGWAVVREFRPAEEPDAAGDAAAADSTKVVGVQKDEPPQ